MRLRPLLPLRACRRRAALPLVSVWLTIALSTMVAGHVFAGRAPAPNLPHEPQTPTGTVGDADSEASPGWTLTGRPHHVLFDSDGTQVAEGATLTVEPGVVVQFDPWASLIVLGTLKAICRASRII